MPDSIFSRLPVSLLIANLLVFGLMFLGGFEWVDDKQYRLLRAQQEDILSAARATFADQARSDWQSLSNDLEDNYPVVASLLNRADDLPAGVAEQLQNRLNQGGLVVPELASVYILLDAEYVLEVQLVGGNRIVDYLSEWVVFVLITITSFIVVAIYLFRHKKHLSHMRNSLAAALPQTTHENDDLTQLIHQVALQQQHLQEDHSRQLASHKDLLHGVAHELRSPMARIQFALDMLPEQNDQTFVEMKRSIDENLNTLDKMISELLNFARLQHQGQVDMGHQIPVTELFHNAINKVQPLYADIHYTMIIMPGIEYIKGNETQLERALVNLLRNAGRYAKKTCQITAAEEGQQFIIYVDDDGEGIPPGKRDRVFEPFTRLDPSRSRDSGGTGLGLAIVQSVVELHHGSVTVEDSPLGGARIAMKLPFNV